MKNENVRRFGVAHHLRLLGSLAVGTVLMTGGFSSRASAQEAMGDTGCFWYENAAGKQGSKVTGIQCPFTSSFGGKPMDASEAGPIPLVTSTGLLKDLNDWLADNNIGSSIQQSSYVGIETLGGKGRNGDSCGACSSGKGAGGGYAITVQTLGGMQSLIKKFGDYVNETTPPLLFVFVGREGLSPSNGSYRGGGGGAGSWVTGEHPLSLRVGDVLFPSAQTNANLNDPTNPVDDLVFAIGGGGGGGGGVRVTGSGKHGGAGGRMNSTGPNVTDDYTAKGEGGDGSNSGRGGSNTGPGLGGAGGGNGNVGQSGIGGMGGLDSNHAGFIGTTFTWGAGLGGSVGGTKAAGGSGGGGWGGGGGGGEVGNNSGGAQGHGGAGGGSWARKSAATVTSLPTLYNLRGSGFSLSDAGFSQVVLSFSVLPSNALTASSDATLLASEPNTNTGADLRLTVGARRTNEVVVHFADERLADFLASGEIRSVSLQLGLAKRNASRQLEIVPIPASFIEGRGVGTGVTWNCAEDADVSDRMEECLHQWPAARFAAGEIRQPDEEDKEAGLISFDVTDDIVAGVTTWLLRSPSRDGVYYSREGALAAGEPWRAPTLLLERWETPSVTQFAGKVEKVGSGTHNAKLQVSGQVEGAEPLDLSAATLELTSVLWESGGAEELLYTLSGPVLPLQLTARQGSTVTQARFETPSGVTPKVQVELKRRDSQTGELEFSLKIERAGAKAAQWCGSAALGTTRLQTAFTLADGLHGAVTVRTTQPWQCEKDQLTTP